MKITILSTNARHPVIPFLKTWLKKNGRRHAVKLVFDRAHVGTGDLLFLISCGQIVSDVIRRKFKHTLVVHASALPKGRGWSPYIWQILEGKNRIPVTLLEAEDRVDSGAIWRQEVFILKGHELYDEINQRLFAATGKLMEWAIKNMKHVKPKKQKGAATYYPKRNPDDSRLNPFRSLAQQFNSLRVADPERYPAYFIYRGHRYNITLNKADNK
jgi:methionyl-tRNA formyltransferase